MVTSPVKPVFLFWWIFSLIICQVFAVAIAGLSLSVKSLKFIEIAVVAHWILLGIMQWRLLNPCISWAYQWGLVSTISGILSSWLVLTLFSSLFRGEESLKASEGILGLFLIILFGGPIGFDFGSRTIVDSIVVAFSAGILAAIACAIGILAGLSQWLLLKWHAPDTTIKIALGSLAWLIVPLAVLIGIPGGYALMFLFGFTAIFIASILGGIVQGKAIILSLQTLIRTEATFSVASWRALVETGGIILAIAVFSYPFKYPILRALGFTRALNEALIEGKIAPNAYFSQGGDPNYQESGISLLHSAALNNNLSLGKALLERGVDPNVREDQTGETPLYFAQSQEFINLLIAYQADVNAQNKDGLTPLHRTKKSAIAQILIDRGADINFRDYQGRTALHNPNRSWISGEEEEIFKLILEQGGEVDAKDNQDKTPLLAIVSSNVRDYNTERKQVKASQLRFKLAKLLIEYGANVKAQDQDGLTALHLVEDPDLARILIENGANVNARDRQGKTPLHSAAAKRNLDVVKLLLEQGVEVDARDNLGKTALHYVAENVTVKQEIIELLVDAGADVNAQDNEGKTPLYYAVKQRNKKSAKVLIDRGANVNIRSN